MKLLMIVLLILAACLGRAAPVLANLEAKDLQQLASTQWQGTLTYLDYSSGKNVSIPSNLIVTPVAADPLAWTFEYQYPDEPKANAKETIIISKDGTMIDGEMIIEKTFLGDNTLKLVTQKSGMDNDKPALFRFTYLLNNTRFSIKKEVQYPGIPEFFARNEYLWKR